MSGPEFPDTREKIPSSVQRLILAMGPKSKQNESFTAMRVELGPPKFAKFPVLFPVSREFRRRKVRS